VHYTQSIGTQPNLNSNSKKGDHQPKLTLTLCTVFKPLMCQSSLRASRTQ